LKKLLNQEPISEEEKKTKTYEIYMKLKQLPTVELSEQNQLTRNFNYATILLTEKCNFECSYCYSQKARSKSSITKEKLKTALDFILINGEKNKYVKIAYLCGGEPTIMWDLLKWSVEYTIIKANEKQIKIAHSLTTNGSLLSELKIKWLKKHNVSINLSFDILPKIQAVQRKIASQRSDSFSIVNDNLKIMLQQNISVSIRSTITSLNVEEMDNMVNFVANNYPEIRKIHFEPVSDVNIDVKNFYQSFNNSFFIALNTAKNKNIKLTCSASININKLRTRFCNSEFCVTPDANLVACHRVSSANDEKFNFFNYGKIENNNLLLDKNKLSIIENNNIFSISHCNFCFAKWHCATSCLQNRLSYSNDINKIPPYCDFIKEMTKKLLAEKLNCFIN